MSRAAALVALHAAVALFGFAALFGKWIALSAMAIVLGRTIVAATTLAAVCLVRGEPIVRPSTALAINGAILAVHWVAFFLAVKIASVAIALLGYATFPLFVLLFERAPASSGSRARDIGIAALAVLGLVAIVPEFSWASGAVQGLVLGIASGLTFAWLAVRSRALVANSMPTHVALWQNAFAALCLAPIVALFDHDASPGVSDIALVLVLGVVCTGIAHTLFIASMRRLSAHTASVVAALEPVYGIVLAAALLHDVPATRTVAGAMLIVAAALFASRRSA